MPQSLLLTVMGEDRPGLVDELAQRIAAEGGNWVESRLAYLAGRFAGVVHVHVEPECEDALRRKLAEDPPHGLQVTSEKVEPRPKQTQQPVFKLEAIGHDRPGIIREIAHALASRGVNLLDLSTWTTSAPMTGDPLFVGHIFVQLPSEMGETELHELIDPIASQLDLDLSVEAKTG